MNSQNPNPNEGQQPGTPSEGSTGQEPELPAAREQTGPENTEPESTEPESHAVPENPTPENPTEPLFPSPAADEPPHTSAGATPPSGTHAGPAYGAPAYGAPGYGRAAQPLNFFDWIRSHGIHRGRDRWIGGVSSGIAERMGIDPLIVRGIFIVLTLFAGIGVLLYGLGWALLPEPDGRIHTQEAGAGRWSTGMTGALITSIIGLTGLGGGFWGWGHDGFGFFWALFWIGGVIYLIYFLTQRNKNRSGAPMDATTGGRPDYGYAGTGNAPAAAAAGSSASPTSTSQFQASTFAAGSHTPTQPYTVPPTPDAIPSYSSAAPYGSTAPTPRYGGGLPPRRPAPVPTPTPKPRPSGPGAPAVAITAGLALLAGGTLKALDAGNLIDLGDSANAVVWAAGAAVLGLGILLAGMRGRTSGVLGFFAVVALIVGGVFSAVPNGDRFRFQNADWNPVSIEQARQGFQITGGRGTVDLTGLNLNPPLGTDVVIPLDATASNVTVLIPRTVPVDVRADMTLGNLNEGADSRSGITSRQSSYNSDKPGARLILQIDGTVSNITIQEGN